MEKSREELLSIIAKQSKEIEELKNHYLLKESEIMLSQILKQIPERIYWKDLNLIYRGGNIAFASDVGFSSIEEILGKNDFQLFGENTALEYIEENKLTLSAGKEMKKLFSIDTEEGIKWFKHSQVPLKDPNGKNIGILGVYQDISALKNVQDLLEKTNTNLENIVRERTKDLQENIDKLENMKIKLDFALKGAKEGLWDWDIEADEVLQDEGYFSILGFSREDIPEGENVWNFLVHPEDKPGVVKIIEESIESGANGYECRYRMKNKNEEWTWILDTGKTVEWETNGRTKRMIGLHRDITDWVYAENKLIEARMMLNLAIEASGLEVVVWDLSKNKDQVYSFSEKLNKKDRKEFLERFEAHFRGETSHFEIDYRTKGNGNKIVFWNNINGRITHSYLKGKPFLFLGTVKDMTVRKKIEDALKKAKEAAESANRLISEFIANVNHELRTPLTVILGMTETLLSSDIEEEFRPLLGSIYTSANNLLSLINDVLKISKIEAGKLNPNFEKINLKILYDNISFWAKDQAEKQSLGFMAEFDDTIPKEVYGDPVLLTQILNNLLSNALKFTHSGNISLKVKLLSFKSKSYKILFSVSDTGIGIREDKLSEIFKRFYQIDSSSKRKYGGTGLGLAIVKETVKILKGEISVESKTGFGTKFEVILKFTSERKGKNDKA